MTLHEAAQIRTSRRRYLDTPMEPGMAEKIQALAAKNAALAGARIEMVFNNGAAFAGMRKSYGLLTGVRHYAGLIAQKDDALAEERLGYYGEQFLLEVVALGLGTCWVVGSFDRKSCPFQLAANEHIYSTIALGHTEQENLRERFIHSITHRKTKSTEDMMTATGDVPDWFMAGMRAVERAPSAVNKQPVRFTYRDGKVTAAMAEGSTNPMLDLGIAKYHFALGTGGGSWEFGNHGAYTREAPCS